MNPDAPPEEIFEDLPGILKIRAYIESAGISSIAFEEEVSSEIEIRQKGSCQFFEFKIDPLRDTENTVRVTIVIMRNGLDHLAYHIEDFSDTEIKAINDACTLKAIELGIR